jgi:hypothetical protein
MKDIMICIAVATVGMIGSLLVGAAPSILMTV